MPSITHFLLLLLIGSAVATAGLAQSRDSIRVGAIPALGYTSDDGVVAGGIASRYVYRDGYRPYRQYQFLSLLATSNGMYAGEVMSEHNARRRRGIRSQISAYVNRVDAVQWFGEGPDTPFDADTYRAGGYDYAAFNALAFYRGRVPIYRTGFPGAQLDAVFGVRLLHNKPFDRDSSKTFWKDAPRGAEGVTTAMLTAGIQWENRDHELDPTRGNTAVIEAGYSQRGALLLTAWLTQYVPIDVGHRFVLAGRLGLIHASGRIPYDLMPAIGGDKTVRGYVVNRFRGWRGLVQCGNPDLDLRRARRLLPVRVAGLHRRRPGGDRSRLRRPAHRPAYRAWCRFRGLPVHPRFHAARRLRHQRRNRTPLHGHRLCLLTH